MHCIRIMMLDIVVIGDSERIIMIEHNFHDVYSK